MILISGIIMITAFVFILTNFKRKIRPLLSLHLIILSFMIIIAVVYFAKTTAYRFYLQSDYSLYLWISTIKIDLNSLSRIYNFCLVMCMLVEVGYVFSFCRIHYALYIVLLLPIIVFSVMTDYAMVYRVYIAANSSDNYLATAWYKFGNTVCECILYFYLLLPLIVFMYKILKTKIFSKKRDYFITLLCISLLNGYTLIIFVIKTFRPLLFSQVDVSRLPKMPVDESTTMKTAFLIFGIMVFVFGMQLLFKPFSRFGDSWKQNKAAELLRNNMPMQLHLYKNAFLALGQQFDLIRINAEKMNIDAVLKSAGFGIDAVKEYQKIINDNLKLLKNTESNIAEIDLIECVLKASKSLSSDIDLIFDFDNDHALILGDEVQITEVFTNIFQNSADAMENIHRKKRMVVNLISEEDCYMITIRDNGEGIPFKNKYAVFEPFFTTKANRINGGIGLYYTKKILSIHSGHIRFKSKPNEYTEFFVVFPSLTYKARRFTFGLHKNIDL